MKYAVKIAGADLPYACVCGRWVDCASAYDSRYVDEATTADRWFAEAVAKARGGKVVRVLSHEEAKRKAAALALLRLADKADASAFEADRHASCGCLASEHARDEAERLWPALFHGGDGTSRWPR
jgi:hypothetical protein